MKQKRLNAYRIMWLFVMFDLPTNTKAERKRAQGFRKKLLKDGFMMKQFSVYIRHCPSSENADVHTNRVKDMLPPEGKVSIIRITDKQFAGINNFWGLKATEPRKAPLQLEMFM